MDERTQERDYALAWLLAGVSATGGDLAFKGGTCLRRCYFEGYRYSEDLDFTVPVPQAGLTVSSLDTVAAWCAWASQSSGLQFEGEGDSGAARRVWVSYAGPLGTRRERAIKVDMSDGDQVIAGVETRILLSEYSDLPGQTYAVPCYSLGEIWAEKTRSLMQRSEPRDAFDLAHLFAQDRNLPGNSIELFRIKARWKGLDPSDLARRFEDREETMRRRWDERLRHQLASVPPFEETWRQVRRALRQAGYLSG